MAHLSRWGTRTWPGRRSIPPAAGPPTWSRPYAPAGALTAVLTVFLVLVAAGNAAMTALEAIDPVVALRPPNPALLVAITAMPVTILGTMACVVLVPVWMHRCYRNLPALGARGLRWSPRWAAAGWFVPLAGWAIPYLVARDLVAAGEPDDGRASRLLAAWWGAWLLTGLVQLLVYRQPVRTGHLPDAPLAALYYGGHVAAALLLLRLVRLVDSRQRERHARLAGADPAA